LGGIFVIVNVLSHDDALVARVALVKRRVRNIPRLCTSEGYVVERKVVGGYTDIYGHEPDDIIDWQVC
jgi:hypothetical protein